jgi:hypothetical protein
MNEVFHLILVVTKVRPFLDEEMTGGKKGKHQCT